MELARLEKKLVIEKCVSMPISRVVASPATIRTILLSLIGYSMTFLPES